MPWLSVKALKISLLLYQNLYDEQVYKADSDYITDTVSSFIIALHRLSVQIGYAVKSECVLTVCKDVKILAFIHPILYHYFIRQSYITLLWLSVKNQYIVTSESVLTSLCRF